MRDTAKGNIRNRDKFSKACWGLGGQCSRMGKDPDGPINRSPNQIPIYWVFNAVGVMNDGSAG